MKTRADLSLTPLVSGVVIGSLALLSIFIQCFPAIGEALQWQRSLSFPQSGLTALTGHLTHWSWDHLLWDVAALVGLGVAAIRILPGRVLLCLLLAALAIPIEIAWFRPEFATYRGLSGVDSALFGLVLAGLWQRKGAGRWLAISGLVGILAKTLFEWTTGDTFFVDRTNQEFIPVTSAHVVGLVCGLFAGLVKRPSAWSGHRVGRSRIAEEPAVLRELS